MLILLLAISDAYYCTECTRLEKDRDGCPRIINVSSISHDLKPLFKSRYPPHFFFLLLFLLLFPIVWSRIFHRWLLIGYDRWGRVGWMPFTNEKSWGRSRVYHSYHSSWLTDAFSQARKRRRFQKGIEFCTILFLLWVITDFPQNNVNKVTHMMYNITWSWETNQILGHARTCDM